ncbi:MAG: hypothetical protein SGJ19_28610 [Planctomycetia bacterium]|nr:hypothetical protein [Planctomycetia bacterium]
MLTEEFTETTTRQCRNCGYQLPLDAQHFHRHSGHRDGFREVCKECRQQLRKDGRQEAYGRAEKTLLLKLAQQIRAGRDCPEHGRLLYCLNQYFGGAPGIAQAMAAQYHAASTSSRTKVSMLCTMYALTIANDRRREEVARQQEERLNRMSPEQLDENLWDLTQKLVGKLGYEIVPKKRRQ